MTFGRSDSLPALLSSPLLPPIRHFAASIILSVVAKYLACLSCPRAAMVLPLFPYPGLLLPLCSPLLSLSCCATARASQAAEAEKEGDASCNGLPMRVCHMVAERAEEDLLPHASALGRVLADQCLAQINDGEDLSESVALEALGMLATTLMQLWDAEVGCLCCFAATFFSMKGSHNSSLSRTSRGAV